MSLAAAIDAFTGDGEGFLLHVCKKSKIICNRNVMKLQHTPHRNANG